MLNFAAPTKNLFLDRAAVQELLDDSTIQPMLRIGGFIRRTARNSMRRRPWGKSSPPNSPPYAHVGLLKTQMAFSYDPRRGSLVVGPMAVNNPPDDTGGYTVPQLMEFGGSFRTREPRYLWVPRGTSSRRRRQPQARTAAAGQWVPLPAGTRLRYPPRPFMSPALVKARQSGKLAAAFRQLRI